MKRKITGAILISLGLGFLWQAASTTALGQRSTIGRGRLEGPCHRSCLASFNRCSDLAKSGSDGRRQAFNIQGCQRLYHSCLGNCVF
jgi:hypothetical protein